MGTNCLGRRSTGKPTEQARPINDRALYVKRSGKSDPHAPPPQRRAETLGISRMTERNHIAAIYAKLGRHSKAELARWIERGGS
ncbi:MAG: hypothetical protein ACKVOP_12485 [Sphingomonadaceae bacterium]